MSASNNKQFRTLHLKIPPGESITDREGVKYVNHNSKVAIRMTVVRENKENERELSPNEKPQPKIQE